MQFIGDMNKKDVSIQLSPAQFSDNGTFFCDVKNPPDVKGTPARTELRVVLKGDLLLKFCLNLNSEVKLIISFPCEYQSKLQGGC